MSKIYKREGDCACLSGKIIQLIIEREGMPPIVSLPTLMCPTCESMWHIENKIQEKDGEVFVSPSEYTFMPNTVPKKQHPAYPEPKCNTLNEINYLVECFPKATLERARLQFETLKNCGKAQGAAKKVVYGLKKYFHSAKRKDVINLLDKAIAKYDRYSGVSWDRQLDIYDTECRNYRRYLRSKMTNSAGNVILGDKVEINI